MIEDHQPAQPTHTAEDWTETTAEDWNMLRQSFLDGLSETKRVAREEDLSHLVHERGILGMATQREAGLTERFHSSCLQLQGHRRFFYEKRPTAP